MAEDDLDLYLDQCQSVLLDYHSTATDAGPFPLPHMSDTPATNEPSWKEHHQSVELIRPVSTDPANPRLSPGERVRSWDAQDVTGELPMEYETVLQAAAQVIGLTPHDVGVVVQLYERQLDKVKKERSRSRSASRSRARSVGRPVSAGRSRR